MLALHIGFLSQIDAYVLLFTFFIHSYHLCVFHFHWSYSRYLPHCRVASFKSHFSLSQYFINYMMKLSRALTEALCVLVETITCSTFLFEYMI